MAANKRSKIALALAGGGPVGGIYEVGAMAALAEALEGVDFTEFDIYVGVSSGAFMSAAVANGLGPATLARMLVDNDSDEVFDPEMLLRPAFSEYLRRALSVPMLFWSSLRQYLSDPLAPSLSGGISGSQPCHPGGSVQQFRNRSASQETVFGGGAEQRFSSAQAPALYRGD
jgi:NTE family protein